MRIQTDIWITDLVPTVTGLDCALILSPFLRDCSLGIISLHHSHFKTISKLYSGTSGPFLAQSSIIGTSCMALALANYVVSGLVNLHTRGCPRYLACFKVSTVWFKVTLTSWCANNLMTSPQWASMKWLQNQFLRVCALHRISHALLMLVA